MKLWKMSIKTGGPKGREAFQWCKEHSIIGVGWSCAYHGVTTLPKDPITLLNKDYPKAVSPVRMIIHQMQPGQLVWLHQQGCFFLCEILDHEPLVGPKVGNGYSEYDVGHARRAEWVQVPEDLVPGKVQRAVISRKMVCGIPCGEHLAKYCAFLHASLKVNPAWRPVLDLAVVGTALRSLTVSELSALVSPDDWEDIIAAHLQTQGWILVKSSCFQRKPRFEFRLIREEAHRAMTAYLQVKSGNQPLSPADYAKDVSANVVVYLFSTNPTDPYPGQPVHSVIPIVYSTIHAWMSEHIALMPIPLCTRLCLVPGSNPASCRMSIGRGQEVAE